VVAAGMVVVVLAVAVVILVDGAAGSDTHWAGWGRKSE
jgi:hypothetical protein